MLIRNNQSLSSFRLKPIQGKSIDNLLGQTQYKSSILSNAESSQNLQFMNKLTYVLVKGKMQPSEKYIKTSMMPYNNATVKIKPNNSRKALYLQKIQD